MFTFHIIMPYILLVLISILTYLGYNSSMAEISALKQKVALLEAEQALAVEVVNKTPEVLQITEKTSATNNNFFAIISIATFIALGFALVFISQNGSTSEVLATHLPKLTEVATNTQLDALEKIAEPLGEKLEHIDGNLVKVSQAVFDLSLKCTAIESKVDALLIQSGIGNQEIPVKVLEQISRDGVF